MKELASEIRRLFFLRLNLVVLGIREKNKAFYEEKSDCRLFLFNFNNKTRKEDSFSMGKLESKFQKELMDEIKERYPGCVIIKNDSSYIQGFPDWTILYKDKWVVLEAKREKGAKKQPNQDYYVEQLDGMSLSRFVYPENKEEVLSDIYKTFES